MITPAIRSFSPTKPAQPGRVGGFTYLALLAFMAIMEIILAAIGEVRRIAQKCEKERGLPVADFHPFRRAIRLYDAGMPISGRSQLVSLGVFMQSPGQYFACRCRNLDLVAEMAH